jgi:hypothetical protein
MTLFEDVLFERVFETLPAKGWLSYEEAQLLYLTAKRTEGPILEVGCYHGRSTALLASLNRPLFAVDPFAGFDSDDPTGQDTVRAFLSNLSERGIHNVQLFRDKIENWTTRQVGFAYLDGEHTYRGTLAQIDKALACGPAMLALHDVNDSGEGLEVKKAAVERLGPWVERIERMAVWDIEYLRQEIRG